MKYKTRIKIFCGPFGYFPVQHIQKVCHAEHSFNASTFAARVVASTRAHMYACTGAALAGLSGELHGGANSQVMKMLFEIDRIDRVEKRINSTLDTGA